MSAAAKVLDWKLNQNSKGMTGTISYLVDKQDMFSLELPFPGSPWPGPGVLPYLRCVTGEWEDYENLKVKASYQFSTERELGEDFVDTSLSYDIEVLTNLSGWTWESTGTSVDIEIPTVEQVLVYTIRARTTSPPRDKIIEALYHINSKKFHGFERETLRFDGATTDTSYNMQGEVTSVRTEYKFQIKTRSHNIKWRPPLVDRDADGNILYWQDKDPDRTDTYTTNPSLVSTPKLVGGAAGIGGWDKPTMGGTAYIYPKCDFATVLGLPRIPGDEL